MLSNLLIIDANTESKAIEIGSEFRFTSRIKNNLMAANNSDHSVVCRFGETDAVLVVDMGTGLDPRTLELWAF